MSPVDGTLDRSQVDKQCKSSLEDRWTKCSVRFCEIEFTTLCGSSEEPSNDSITISFNDQTKYMPTGHASEKTCLIQKSFTAGGMSDPNDAQNVFSLKATDINANER